MKILTANQMREWDAYTIAHEPISSLNLMERAATALADAIARRWEATDKLTLKVFAGSGNNGGDALAVTRLLVKKGYQAEAFLFNTERGLSDDCRANLKRLREELPDAKVVEVTSQFEPPVLTKDDLVIDGLFGTGLNKPLGGGFASLVQYINRSEAQVVAIDMPSGLMAEDNTYNILSNIVKASVTLTLQLPKPAFFFADNHAFVGEWEVLDIGLHPDYLKKINPSYTLVDEETLSSLLLPRNPFGHKGSFGHALLIAGSAGMAGASILAARACLRSGVGKLTVHTPKANSSILQIAVPEAVLHCDECDTCFSESFVSDDYQAVAIGPGLGRNSETALAFIEQVKHNKASLVIDADGLNILGDHKGWISQLPRGTVLTPHLKEFERIAGNCLSEFHALSQARELAIKQQIFIVLKGHYTAICTPEGKVQFNNTGNAGMATAGSGDVLTGILLGLLARGYSQSVACYLGVYLHGLAGDLAARQLGEESLIAGDIIRYLPAAFRQLERGEKK